jgi:hypothetical protein
MNEPPKIITHCIRPPIPMRDFDWVAYEDGNEESGPCGYGDTENAAVCNLLELLALEEEDARS